LHRQVEAYSAKRGVVMVMDAKDGSLLALASDPSYDPNEYYKSKVETFKNWALTDLYEPGSTFKPINVAIALESGAVKASDYFYDAGQIYVDGWPINNADGTGRGSMSVADIIKYSSNIGMVHIMEQLKSKDYYQWLQKVGMGQTTGMDLPFEVAGHLKDLKTFTGSPIEPATTAFGQGFSLTPMKLCQLVGALANGGKLVTPHVVRGLYDSDGQPYWQPDRPVPKQVFSPKNTQAILNMMELVVSEGTGKNAQVPGYRIAGKTGTAQKAGAGGGYGNARITSFISVFPVEAPRYVVIAIVDEPQGADAYGGTVAAPIVKDVIAAIIGIEKIPPSLSAASENP
jgi:cell division protein FtsI (penicillin-binding protein 3)